MIKGTNRDSGGYESVAKLDQDDLGDVESVLPLAAGLKYSGTTARCPSRAKGGTVANWAYLRKPDGWPRIGLRTGRQYTDGG